MSLTDNLKARDASASKNCGSGVIWLPLSVSIDLVSSSARVTSVKSAKGVSVTDGHPDPKIGPQVYLGPIKIK